MTLKKLSKSIRYEIGRLEVELEEFVEFGCEGYGPVEYAAEKAFFEGRIFALTNVLADLEQ